MKDFLGKIAVVTGGGSGMGREIVRQLVADGCNVAMCDVSVQGMAETKRLCESGRLLQGQRITTHLADVSDEAQVLRFRDEVAAQQETDHIHLLFNDAGVTGGGSMFTDDRAAWDRTFAICWGASTTTLVPFCRCCGGPTRRTSSTRAASMASGRQPARMSRTRDTRPRSSR